MTLNHYCLVLLWISINSKQLLENCLLHITLSLIIYIENVGCKFERDITFIQLLAIWKIVFNKEICIYEEEGEYKRMFLNVDNPDDIKLMKVI